MDKILKVAKRLKTFTLDDIVMFCEIDEKVATEFLMQSENIKQNENFYEYVETSVAANNLKIIDLNKKVENSDISICKACEIFLKNCKSRNLKPSTIKDYRSFINAHIIPYFKNILLKNIAVTDVEKFANYLRNKSVSNRRIKNILTLLNQIIKYFQNEGYIERTCVFEVKRLEKIPKRKVHILSKEQLAQLFKLQRKNINIFYRLFKK